MNLLVTGAFSWTEEQLNSLRTLGHNVVFMQQENASLPCDAKWVEGVIGNGIFLHHNIEAFSSLKFIQLTSAGFDRVPMDYVETQNIQIFNAKGVYSIPMAEFVLGGVLQLYKQSAFFQDNKKVRKWEKHRGLLELYQKNVCIVGCGSVGNECAKRFKGFGCKITGVDIKPYQNDLYDSMVSIENLDNVLSNTDILLLTVPLIKSTKHLMNVERFNKMKSGAVLVNIARGAVVDTDALVTALKSKLMGAVLDVFEEEPLSPNNVLWDLDNVIITPHNSFVGQGNHKRMFDVIMSNLEGFTK